VLAFFLYFRLEELRILVLVLVTVKVVMVCPMVVCSHVGG